MQHHERLDGQGYPDGLTASEIAPLAKIVMVVDEYDEMCHNPDRAHHLMPNETLSLLYQNQMVKQQQSFSAEVLIALIRTLGVYPPGTLVELTDGSIGAVININSATCQSPQILLYDPDLPKNEAIIIDIAAEGLAIKQSLRPNRVSSAIRGFLSPKLMKGYIPSYSEEVVIK